MNTLRGSACLLVCLTVPMILFAQTVTLTGKVTKTGTEEPIIGAIVRAMDPHDTTKVKGTFTDNHGQFSLKNLEAGEYRVRFSCVGFVAKTISPISITVGDTMKLNVALDSKLIDIDAVIVSASRRQEKLLEAPASVSLLEAQEISERPAFTPVDHVRATTGVDVAQTGLAQYSVVTRGFNNVASTALTILTDNRMAAVPSLRINIPSFIPLVNDDIDRIEVVRGPASALYGPNATSGVMNIITRSPFASRGTALSVTGGERSLFQSTFRHAGVIGEKIGFKLSGQYFRARDWEYVDSAEAEARAKAIAQGAKGENLKIGKRDPFVERFSGELRADLILTDNVIAIASFGWNQSLRSIELTDIGAVQTKDWRYTYFQGRITYGDLFLQAFLNQSHAGTTYLLRSGQAVVDRSRQFVTQAQHSLSFGETQRFIYGADLMLTRPVTDGTINGRNEDNDDIDEYGGYLQSETHLLKNKLDVVLVGRVDKHSELQDAVFSPRAALVVKPWENQSFRLTYNRAYNTPATQDLFLDIVADPNLFGLPPEYAVALRASGVPKSGLNFQRDANGRPFMFSTFNPDRKQAIPVDGAAALWPAVVGVLATQGIDISAIPSPTPLQVRAVMAMLNPETASFDVVAEPKDVPAIKPTITQTVELGYKGVFGEKLLVSIDLYRSRLRDFAGALQIVTPNVFLNPADVAGYLTPFVGTEQAGQLAQTIGQIPLGTVSPNEAVDPTALIIAPRNYGKVDVSGLDLGIEYNVNEQISFAGTYSYVDKNFFEKLEGVTDLSLNAPRHKGSISARYRNSELGLNGELRFRRTEGFRMRSGVYVGKVEPYTLVDARIGYAIPSVTGLTFTLSATNILDKKHQEFIGAPAIGRLLLGRLAYAF